TLRLLVTTVVALALATSLAALLAARSAKEEQMEALLPVVIMAAYGATMLAMFAPGFSPLWRAAVQALPTTWFIEAANADLIGST
ncbi:hypothetical protein, partial [Leucobacter sp. M11]|uniref:hypothetical protein n=1 Tax=Leucobacter sp. M11 TaxID=2993565 RepID=UPI002DA933B7|nr:hypothetical protein [Leucobacter sp. M11]